MVDKQLKDPSEIVIGPDSSKLPSTEELLRGFPVSVLPKGIGYFKDGFFIQIDFGEKDLIWIYPGAESFNEKSFKHCSGNPSLDKLFELAKHPESPMREARISLRRPVLDSYIEIQICVRKGYVSHVSGRLIDH